MYSRNLKRHRRVARFLSAFILWLKSSWVCNLQWPSEVSPPGNNLIPYRWSKEFSRKYKHLFQRALRLIECNIRKHRDA